MRLFDRQERGEISIRKVLGQLYVGSCPRQRSHIDQLHSLGVTVVVNFQTEEDCKRNCVAGIGMEEDPLAVSRIYDSRGMQYIWMPTFDMSTDGRAQMLPQASFLFGQLIRRGHTVYSHCNAGVGRSVAAACGYLTFFLGLTQRQMQHVMASSRPVAYFDFEAMERARPRFHAMFGGDELLDTDGKCKDMLFWFPCYCNLCTQRSRSELEYPDVQTTSRALCTAVLRRKRSHSCDGYCCPATHASASCCIV